MRLWEQGDIVKISLDPTKGHEQAGYRPAVVIQNNALTAVLKSVVVVLPISNTTKELPFQVALDDRTKTTGSILCRQIRALDLSSRQTTFVEKLPYDLLQTCIENVKMIIEIVDRSDY